MSIENIFQARWLLTELVNEGSPQFEKWCQTVDEPTRQAIEALKESLPFYNYEPSLAELLTLKPKKLAKVLKNNKALAVWLESNLTPYFLRAAQNWNQKCFEYFRSNPNVTNTFETLRVQSPQLVREYLDDPKLLQQPTFSGEQLLVLIHVADYKNVKQLLKITHCLDSKELPKHLVECVWLSLDQKTFIKELETQAYSKKLVYKDLSPTFKTYICKLIINQNKSTLAYVLISDPGFFDYLRKEEQEALLSFKGYTFESVYRGRTAPRFVRLLAESYYVKKQHKQTQKHMRIEIAQQAKSNLRDLKRRLREMDHQSLPRDRALQIAKEKRQPADLLTLRETSLFKKLMNRPFVVQHGTWYFEKIKAESNALMSVDRRKRVAYDKHLATLPKDADSASKARASAEKEVVSHSYEGAGNTDTVFWAYKSTSDSIPDYLKNNTIIELDLGKRLSEHPYEAKSWWCSESFRPYFFNHTLAPVQLGNTWFTMRYRHAPNVADFKRICVYRLPNGEVREEVFGSGAEVAVGMEIPVFRYLRIIEQLRLMDDETYNYVLSNVDNDAVIESVLEALTRVRAFELHRSVRQPLNIPEVNITPATNIDQDRLKKLCEKICDNAPIDKHLLNQNLNVLLASNYTTNCSYDVKEDNKAVAKKFSLLISHPLALAVGYASIINSLRWVEALIKHGADINFQGSNTVTAILIAIAYGNEQAVEFLIKQAREKQNNRVCYPVNMNVITANMNPDVSPITLATRMKKLNIMRLVLENGGADSEVFLKEAIEIADKEDFDEGFFLLLQYVPNPWFYYSRARASSANMFIEICIQKLEQGISPEEFLSAIAANDDLLRAFIKLPPSRFIDSLKKVKDESIIIDYFKLLVANKYRMVLDLSLLNSIISLPKTNFDLVLDIIGQASKWDYFTKDDFARGKQVLAAAKQKTSESKSKRVPLELLYTKLKQSRFQILDYDISLLVERNESQMLVDEDFIIASTSDELMLKLMACELKANQESQALMEIASLFNGNIHIREKELQVNLAAALTKFNLSSALQYAHLQMMDLSNEEADYAMLFLHREFANELKISLDELILSDEARLDGAKTIEGLRRVRLMLSTIKILHYVSTTYPSKVDLIQEIIKEHQEALSIIDPKKAGKEQLFDLLKANFAKPESRTAPKAEIHENNGLEKAAAKVVDCKHIYYTAHFNRKFTPEKSRYLATEMQQDESNHQLFHIEPEQFDFYKHAREKLKYKVSDAVTYTVARSRDQSDAVAQFKAKPSLRNWYRAQWDSAINRALVLAVSCTVVGALAMLIYGLHESGVLREDKRISKGNKNKKPIEQAAYDKKVSEYQLSRKDNQAVWQASVARRCIKQSSQLPEMQKRILLCSGG